MLSLLFGAGLATAAVIPSSCDFYMNGTSPHQGPFGQLKGGQIRFGDIAPLTFHMQDDKIWDSARNGCWWARELTYSLRHMSYTLDTELTSPSPTHVLQCGLYQLPDAGFTVGCDGKVSYRGQQTFYQCETGDGKQWNIYLKPDQGMRCGEMTITADGCRSKCAPPPLPSTQTPTQTPTLTPTSTPTPSPPPVNNCPANLSGRYEFPHLIIPVDKSKPDKAAGTSYFGQVTATTSSLFNFDIPAADANKTCTLVFLFPKQSQLATSSFTISGGGKVGFSMLTTPASNGTTWNNKPAKKTDFGIKTLVPGNNYTITSFPCPAGQAIGFEMSDGDDTKLRYFQDYNPSPSGCMWPSVRFHKRSRV